MTISTFCSIFNIVSPCIPASNLEWRSQKCYNIVMKLCKYCNKYFPESDFGIAGTIRDKTYRRLKCKFCYSKTKKLLKEKYQKILDAYKIKNGCVKCGIKDHRVLEFHHKSDKKFSIAYARYNHFGIERVRNEIKKCVVICANCHRILHYGTAWTHDGKY